MQVRAGFAAATDLAGVDRINASAATQASALEIDLGDGAAAIGADE